ncbi:hypothetical protein MMH89_01075 [Candidatus Comchoanobacter bicostacola]|uniref:DUF3570 domain-containing protein n=1 Tax=Candidatus Comchoanobacter bicostacola TaxID=2919598 RepID=A0ABY5DJQ6_9GAMM|nr:hypothetical protein [Candidatus Comchoanobacter bicostacola]UTC24748.1 hypothetical protein MMH89_01075 [Candidatus Comchoanobacter bicostacola]
MNKNFLYSSLLIPNLIFGNFHFTFNTGVTSKTIEIKGRIIKASEEMDFYEALYDLEDVKRSLDNLLIVPHKAVYVKSKSTGTPWEASTEEYALLKVEFDTTLTITQPNFTKASGEGTASVKSIYKTNGLIKTELELTNMTADPTAVDSYTVVNSDYSSVRTWEDSNGNTTTTSEHVVALLDSDLLYQASRSVSNLVDAAATGETVSHFQIHNPQVHALEASAQAGYEYENFISAFISAHFDFPLTSNSGNNLSLIDFTPEYNYGTAAGISVSVYDFTQVSIAAGAQSINGKLSASLPKKDGTDIYLSPIKYEYANDTTDYTTDSYPEVTDMEINEYAYYIDLGIQKKANTSAVGFSAHARYAFEHEPGEYNTSLSKFKFNQTSLNLAMSYSI